MTEFLSLAVRGTTVIDAAGFKASRSVKQEVTGPEVDTSAACAVIFTLSVDEVSNNLGCEYSLAIETSTGVADPRLGQTWHEIARIKGTAGSIGCDKQPEYTGELVVRGLMALTRIRGHVGADGTTQSCRIGLTGTLT